MKKATKIALITAACCIALGSVAAFAGLRLVGFDIRKMSTVRFEEKTYEIRDSFQSIEIYGIECDVSLVPTSDENCRVECSESDKIGDTVEVRDGTLTVTRRDTRRWYESIGFFWNSDLHITVYLPEREYKSLQLKTVSGDIEVPESFSFEKTELQSVSGNISFAAGKSGDLTVKSTSGDISIRNTEAYGLEATAVSGDIRLSGVRGSGLNLKTTSGEISAASVMISGKADIETVSGDVELNHSDADSFRIKTTSGDVDGSFLSPKVFETDTTSGRVHVPSSASGSEAGECYIKTTSGDIRITVVS